MDRDRSVGTSRTPSGSRCGDGCEDCILQLSGKRFCTKTEEVSLSDLHSETVLEFLDKKNWQNCPCCLETVQRENLPFHFIFFHPEIYDIAGKTNQTKLVYFT